MALRVLAKDYIGKFNFQDATGLGIDGRDGAQLRAQRRAAVRLLSVAVGWRRWRGTARHGSIASDAPASLSLTAAE